MAFLRAAPVGQVKAFHIDNVPAQSLHGKAVAVANHSSFAWHLEIQNIPEELVTGAQREVCCRSWQSGLGFSIEVWQKTEWDLSDGFRKTLHDSLSNNHFSSCLAALTMPCLWVNCRTRASFKKEVQRQQPHRH